MSPLSRKEHDSTWDPCIKEPQCAPVACSELVGCPQAAGGIEHPKPGEGPGTVCLLSSRRGSAQRSHPPSQPWVVAVGRAVTTEKDEKHMEEMDEEE